MANNQLAFPPHNAINNIIDNNIRINNIVDNNVNIEDINNNILNNRPAYFLAGNDITFVENGINQRVPFINPINWDNYVNMNAENRDIICINYEYWVLHLFAERNYYNDMIRQMEIAQIDRYIMSAHNMDRALQILRHIDDDINRLGNIYLGIFLNNPQN